MLSLQNTVTAPVAENDAGVLLKPDGTFQVFTTAKYEGDPATWPDWQIKQARKLQVLAFVLANDALYGQIDGVLDQLEAQGVEVDFQGAVN